MSVDSHLSSSSSSSTLMLHHSLLLFIFLLELLSKYYGYASMTTVWAGGTQHLTYTHTIRGSKVEDEGKIVMQTA